MHELSIALAVVESAGEAARRHGADAVEPVRLRVGELSGVVADALRFSFEVAAAGTALAGAGSAPRRRPPAPAAGRARRSSPRAHRRCCGARSAGSPGRSWWPAGSWRSPA